MLLEWPALPTLHNEFLKPLLPAIIPEDRLPVVVSHAGHPQALLFVNEDFSSGKFECESLKFSDLSQAGEILNFLLAALTEHALLKKCHTLFFFFDKEAPEAPILQKALASHSWSVPELFIMSCYFDRSFDPPWLHANFRIPPQFSFKQWKELTPKHISRLKEKGRDSIYPPTLSPFKYDHPDPEFSLALLVNDEVIGWVMTRRVQGNLLAYSTLFVETSYKMFGLAIPMMAESIKRVMHSSIPAAYMDTYVTLSEPYWIEFVNKRLKPRSIKVIDTYRSYKRVGTR